MAKLDPAIAERIKSVCAHGERLAATGEHSFAISKYYEALRLIPDPKSSYKATTWIYTAIGETQWLMKDYNNAGVAFLKAYRCTGGAGQGIVNLRLGECLAECGENDLARQYLAQAYEIGGEAIFESENSKYYELIRKQLEGANAPEDEDDEDDENYDPSEDIGLLSNLLASRGSEDGAMPVVVDDYNGLYDDDDDGGYAIAPTVHRQREERHPEPVKQEETGFLEKASRLIKMILNIK